MTQLVGSILVMGVAGHLFIVGAVGTLKAIGILK